MLPADCHVHSEWSFDAARGDMAATCARAARLGLPAIAFTEHTDHTSWACAGTDEAASATRVVARGRSGEFDAVGYWECLQRCRHAYPQLRILSGVEIGEPHRFPRETADLLNAHDYDRILGSVHCVEMGGELVDACRRRILTATTAADRFRGYLADVEQVVSGPAGFAILAHLDYARRAWPADIPFRLADFEEEYRAVLRALARSGRALEVNTNRGRGSDTCPPLAVLRWWRAEGGRAVSFGSDAHDPATVAHGFTAAAAAVEACGFRPAPDPTGLWLR